MRKAAVATIREIIAVQCQEEAHNCAGPGEGSVTLARRLGKQIITFGELDQRLRGKVGIADLLGPARTVAVCWGLNLRPVPRRLGGTLAIPALQETGLSSA